MHGPHIVARTLSEPTSGSGRQPFKYGNSWQYHSRSDRHSKIACWGLVLDLLLQCELLRQHIVTGKVGLGINHEMRDFRNNKTKNLDLVLCRMAPTSAAGGSKGGARGSTSFRGLVSSYGIILSESDRTALASVPDIGISGVGNVLLAVEAKAAMTAYQKARPRLHDELSSSHQTIHGDNDHAIAAGLVIVNAAATFVSPDINKWPLSERPPEVSQHNQPRSVGLILEGLRNLQRRAKVGDEGFDAIGVEVIDCKNDGSPVEVIDRPPAPPSTDDFDYGRFVNRVAHLYASRFASV